MSGRRFKLKTAAVDAEIAVADVVHQKIRTLGFLPVFSPSHLQLFLRFGGLLLSSITGSMFSAILALFRRPAGRWNRLPGGAPEGSPPFGPGGMDHGRRVNHSTRPGQAQGWIRCCLARPRGLRPPRPSSRNHVSHCFLLGFWFSVFWFFFYNERGEIVTYFTLRYVRHPNPSLFYPSGMLCKTAVTNCVGLPPRWGCITSLTVNGLFPGSARSRSYPYPDNFLRWCHIPARRERQRPRAPRQTIPGKRLVSSRMGESGWASRPRSSR